MNEDLNNTAKPKRRGSQPEDIFHPDGSDDDEKGVYKSDEEELTED